MTVQTITVELTSTGMIFDFLNIVIIDDYISPGETLFLGLITNVTNITEIRKKVISGQINCVLIKPSLIPR